MEHLKGFEREEYENLISALNQLIHNASSPKDHNTTTLETKAKANANVNTEPETKSQVLFFFFEFLNQQLHMMLSNALIKQSRNALQLHKRLHIATLTLILASCAPMAPQGLGLSVIDDQQLHLPKIQATPHRKQLVGRLPK
jgi:hypothetical protein